MKTNLISLTLLIAATFMFTGCPSKVEPENPNIKPPVEEPEQPEEPGKPSEPVSTDDLQTIKINDDIMAIIGSNNWNAITYGKGKYVAVGNNYSVAYSTDGINWTQTSPEAGNTAILRDIVYDSMYFIAVGGRLAYSTNLSSWSQVKSGDGTGYPSNGLNKILVVPFVNDDNMIIRTYFGKASTMSMYVSTDRKNWTYKTTAFSNEIPNKGTLYEIYPVYVPGIKGVRNLTLFYYASNGFFMSKIFTPELQQEYIGKTTVPITNIQDIHYINDRYWITTKNSPDAYKGLFYSDDGLSWTNVNPFDRVAEHGKYVTRYVKLLVGDGSGKLVCMGKSEHQDGQFSYLYDETAVSIDGGITWGVVNSVRNQNSGISNNAMILVQ